jgi:hypothetical protein
VHEALRSSPPFSPDEELLPALETLPTRDYPDHGAFLGAEVLAKTSGVMPFRSRFDDLELRSPSGEE